MFLLDVQGELTIGAFLSGCFVMGKTTVGTVLMNSQSIVQNAMKMETSSAKTNVVYQSKFFHEKYSKNFLNVNNTDESLCLDKFYLVHLSLKDSLGCKSKAIKCCNLTYKIPFFFFPTGAGCVILKTTVVTILMRMRKCVVASTGSVQRVSLGVETTSAYLADGVVTMIMTVGTSLMKKTAGIINAG